MSEHTVKSYDDELAHLTGLITRMGGLAEAQFAAAIEALADRDIKAAAKVVAADARIDELEQEVQGFTIRLLALRQPMAVDLRQIVTSLKISGELERIGDYAANIAKRAMALDRLPEESVKIHAVVELAALVRRMISSVLDAHDQRDMTKAVEVWNADQQVDDSYVKVFQIIVDRMASHSESVAAGSQLLFIAKNLERIGDHATNVAEALHYMVRGNAISGERPKGHEFTAD
jgi:phosphate transport system protein